MNDLKIDLNELTRSDQHNGAYLLIDPVTSKTYVGSCSNLYMRLHRHRHALRKNKHHNLNLQELFNAGVQFQIKFYITETRDEAYDYEQKFIDEYRAKGLLLNVVTDVRSRTGTRSPLITLKERKERLQDERSQEQATPYERGYSKTQKFLDSRKLKHKPVSINGVVYPSVRDAANALGMVLSVKADAFGHPSLCCLNFFC